MNSRDYLVRAMLGANQARILAVRTTGVVTEAQRVHRTTPVATVALGRTLTMGLVLGAMLKADETLTIQIKGDGPLQGIVVSANSRGQVKGYVGNPHVELPLNSSGKLSVGEAVGQGYLHVIRDMGLKEPYYGTVPLQTGEIGDDFAYYFAVSEQTPSTRCWWVFWWAPMACPWAAAVLWCSSCRKPRKMKSSSRSWKSACR